MPYAANLTTLLEREPLPAAGLTSAELDYEVDGVACRGYVSRPADEGSHPAVLVLHDWLGVTDYVRVRADMLARLGYVALAGDVFGADVRPSEEEAPQVAGGFYRDQALFRRRVLGAFDTLLAQPGADRSRTAAIGYCFGGAGVLQLARTGTDVGGVVSFHGALQTGPEGEAAKIRAKVNVQHGAVDPVVPDEAVVDWEEELRAAPEVDWQLTAYAGAMHAFTLPEADAPDQGAQFHPVAERRSWQAMKTFLAEVFGEG